MKEALIRAVKRIFSSVFYVGFIPFAPGTWGSLVAVGILILFRGYFSQLFLLDSFMTFAPLALLALMAGTWASSSAEEIYGTEDPGAIVIDEVLGQLLTFTLITEVWTLSASSLVLGFFLFRFFDIVKPWPVHCFERIGGGLGVMMDDVAAGLLACTVLHGIVWIFQYVSAAIS
ncbi:MAG: phosphatidylglycerophosphatase A family protein [Fibrobacterota bacterium]